MTNVAWLHEYTCLQTNAPGTNGAIYKVNNDYTITGQPVTVAFSPGNCTGLLGWSKGGTVPMTLDFAGLGGGKPPKTLAPHKWTK
eukprot:CAMPEP_0175843620 /NCGR_PEP_ID=MMETSP0107_2-20121207/21188_1 /TAXON_ID=195067 ORGANISM="Goniomonas pacifica, Strain CCMP1869" /NCGR_SAMPLE_ID=MMETSP0107_2 /ASSEMBLY_ACC=CAM_ASM_000203 /LENGTH=84 /DNA_ID=CAMNT_0017157923 /DNA_START=48 /DNA_END=302 /DNA_ORIENTATION=-